jgi:ribosomal protein S18 acetylase RimI-like enzyme
MASNTPKGGSTRHAITNMHLLRLLLYRLVDSLKAFCGKGLAEGFVSFGRIVVNVFFRHSVYAVLAYMLPEQVFAPDSRPDLVIHQIATREEIDNLSSIAKSVDMARFYKMFVHGSICFSAYQNDRVVGYGWVSQEVDRSVNRVQPPLRSGDACMHDLFVSAAHRGQGIGEALVSHRLRFLRENRYKRAIAAVQKKNVSALRLHKKAGYTQIGQMFHTRILFWDSFRYDIINV